MPDTQNTLRDTLTASFDAAETASAPEVQASSQPKVETQPAVDTKARDEAGKFTKAEKTEPAVQATEVTTPKRPSTWKKDHWEAFDKLAVENPKLAEYINQRESEFKTGVSTYKGEADKARELNEAMAPFIPLLQQHNIQPSQWISNLGNAHRILALGSPDQKLQAFAKLAQDYGVPLPGLQQPQNQQDPRFAWVEQQLNQVNGQLSGFLRAQQEQQQGIVNKTIEDFRADTVNYPHFEEVREQMARFLDAGLASDLPTAYKMAVRSDDGLFEGLLSQHQQNSLSQQQAAVNKAKSQAISVKGSTPRAATETNGKQDRRSLLEQGFSEMNGGRL